MMEGIANGKREIDDRLGWVKEVSTLRAGCICAAGDSLAKPETWVLIGVAPRSCADAGNGSEVRINAAVIRQARDFLTLFMTASSKNFSMQPCSL